MPDLVVHESNGLLADDGNATQVADAICRILSDRTLADRLGAAGRAFVLPRFAATRLLDDVHVLYQQLLRQHGVHS